MFTVLTCEEKIKDAEKSTFNETLFQEDIRKMMASYTDWGELLESAPFAIYGLGKMLILSNQKKDFPVDNINFKMFPKKFNYPKSIRSSLLQISRQGNLAFLKAQKNMEKIRMYNSNVSSNFKEVTRYLMSKKHSYMFVYPRKSVYSIQESADKSQELSIEVVKEFKIVAESIEEMMMATKQMELRRRNTQPIVERNKSLYFTKAHYIEAIKSLQNALNELTKLKNAWMKLIEFYSKMSILINKSTEENCAALTEISVKNKTQLEDEEIFANLMDKIQKATEASILVREVSDMYADISGMYIVDQMAHLDKMMNATEVDMDKLQLELTWSTESDSEGIRHFIKADEISLREKIADRHNQIVNEYKWMMDCFSPKDREF